MINFFRRAVRGNALIWNSGSHNLCSMTIVKIKIVGYHTCELLSMGIAQMASTSALSKVE